MNGPNWLERIRGLVPQRRSASNGQTREVRNRSRGGVVFVLLLVGFLVVAVAASGLNGGRMAMYLPGVNGFTTTAGNGPATDPAHMFGAGEETANEGVRAPAHSTTTDQEPQSWDRMIIRTATLQLRVKDVSASMDAIRGVVGGHAGYVTGSESRQEGDYTVGTMTVQVPAAQFDGAMSQLRTLGIKVLNESVSSSDVTEEFTDLNSQLRNLRATESRILELMNRAEAIGDILSLDRELRGIQGEIERIQGRVNFLGKRAEMSTITVSLYPEAITVEPNPQVAEAWDPVRIAGEAWEASLQLLANVGTLVITVVVFLWWLLPLAMLAALFLRRTRRTMPTAPTATAAE
ncbi:MAG: DUF4349 domain-containing protein [Chloroflexota bacterium]|nr:DUF4349 domain-containing protein [Chloroflexota bacterium]